ncbi:MAG: diguanylate cyclase [Azospirillum sp.]|nr:diguanylate cyclase [Azospirillum sp.]
MTSYASPAADLPQPLLAPALEPAVSLRGSTPGAAAASWSPALGLPVPHPPTRLPRRRLADALARVAELEEHLTAQQERIAYLESLTMTDELTGLANRRGFRSHFQRELAESRRVPSAMGVLVMIDLDGFKAINDRYGHLAGDAYLRQVARLLGVQVRPQDVVARLGGDEFAVLITNTDPATGGARASELARAANAASLEWHGHPLPIRLSVGVEPYGPSDREDEVIRRADAKMYAQKQQRRGAR